VAGEEMTVGVAACASVEYWDKWGGQFVDMIEQLPTKPDEIVVASLVPLDVPDFIRNVRTANLFWDSWNDGFAALSTEYVWGFGLDDLIMPNWADGLVLDTDVVSITGEQRPGGLFQANEAGFARMLESGNNPMSGSMIMRRQVVLDVPFRRTRWADWVWWLEVRKHGYSVRFDKEPRFVHVRHAEALSLNSDVQGQADVELVQSMLAAGDIVRGQEFPPVAVK
jgi:hypothetical protein